jgi:nucleotide-binding universal stress UspA family protein
MARTRATFLRVLDAHVDITDEFAPNVETAVQRVSARWAGEMQNVLERAGIDGDVVVARRGHGEPIAATITRVAGERDAMAIAAETRGHGALRHALFGSVALDVVKGSRLPVLTTGPKIAATAPAVVQHILLAHDGSERANDIVIDLEPLLRNAEVAVTAVRVFAGSEAGESEHAEAERQLAEFGRRFGPGVVFNPRIRVTAAAGGIEAALLAEAADCHADVIALSTHGYSAGRHLVAGSTALGLLSHAAVPVLLGRVG